MLFEKLKRHVTSTLITAVNILIIIITLNLCSNYIQSVQKDAHEQSLKNFRNAVSSMEQTAYAYMINHQSSVDDWGQYINNHHFSLDEAYSFLNKINSDNKARFHLINTYTLKGISNKIDFHGNNEIDYSHTKDLFFDDVFLGNHTKPINISNMYTNPEDGLPVISFARLVWIWEGDKSIPYSLLKVVSSHDIQKNWSFPIQFNDVQISLIKRNGDYIIRAKDFKNSNFWEFLRIYNDLSYIEIDKLSYQMLTSNKVFQKKDAYGNDVFYACCPSKGNGDWCFIGYLPVTSLGEEKMNWMLVTLVTIGFFVILLIDGTVILYVNNKLKRSIRETQEANMAKTRFLSSMSHDIRTPLNAIIGMTTIASKHTREPEKIKDCLSKIAFSGTHLLTLVNDVLDISKIESGQANLSPHSFFLPELIRNLESVGNVQNQEKNLDFEVICKNIRYPQLIADELRLNQIFINLLTNAFKYTPEKGSVTVTFDELTIPGDNESIKLVYTVSDTGIGMSPDFQKKMYDAFSRSADTRFDQVQGSGLGLTITKQMVELMNGNIFCKSVEGQGTRFTVILSLRIDKSVLNKRENEKNQENTGRFFGVTLLVAEDNDLNWEILNELLCMNNIRALRAEDGQTCIDMLHDAKDNEFDAILMDIQMPFMNGLEATKEIRQMKSPKKDIPIIAMTADAFPEDIKACFNAGMNGHISKPIDMKKLFNELGKYC